jgi:hypothetical protein
MENAKKAEGAESSSKKTAESLKGTPDPNDNKNANESDTDFSQTLAPLISLGAGMLGGHLLFGLKKDKVIQKLIKQLSTLREENRQYKHEIRGLKSQIANQIENNSSTKTQNKNHFSIAYLD